MKAKQPEVKRRERGTGRLYQRGGEGSAWWMQYYCRGKAIRASTGEVDEKKAAKVLKQRLAEVMTRTHRDTRNLKFEDLRSALLDDFATNQRKSLHKAKDGSVYLDSVKRLSFFEGYRANEIDADAIRRYQQEQRAEGLANATINRSVSALRRMFSLARREERLRDLPYFPMLKEAAPRSGFIERAGYDKLFAALPDYLRPVLALGWTGMRKSEVLNLRWDQIDFIANTIRLRPGETKNDQPRVIPLTAPLRALLLERLAKRQPGCEHVCFRVNRLGNAERVGNFRKAWQSVCCKLGLGKMEPADGMEIRKDRPRGKPRQKRIYNGLLFHDLRRSAVRNMVNAGVPEKTSMQISGHLTRSVFDRYNIVSEKNVLDAGRKLEEYFEKFEHNSSTESHQDAAGGKLVH